MFIANLTFHYLISDYIDQNDDLSETSIIEVMQNPESVSVVVLTGEVGKVQRKFGIEVNFTELEI